MNYFHCLHKFMATSKKRKKGERASPACFFLLLTSIIPLSHSHRLAAFIRFLHHTVPPPFLILYLEDKPHFIPTQQQSQKNTVALRHCGWMWSDDQPQYGLSWVFFFYKFLLRIYGCGLYVAVPCLETVQEPKVRLDKHMLFAASPHARTSGHFHRGDD